jgi:PhzF family phenazine biosynthesis protein
MEQDSATLFELKARPAKSRRPRAEKAAFAEALGVREEEIGAPLWVDNGMEQMIVPLASVDAVRRVAPEYQKLRAATAEGGRPQAYVFAPTGPETLVARYFFSKGESLMEDPATGSATANLGGFYLANDAQVPLVRTIAQGEQALRPSTLRLRIDAGRNVFVAGEAQEIGRGTIDW